MQTNFIPIDYDYFDFKGKNYVRIIGRNEKSQQICIIDSCDVYLWAILNPDVKKSEIPKIQKQIEKIKLDVKGRKTKVTKTELHEKNFLGKKYNAIKIYATNYKDLQDIAERLPHKSIHKIRGYDLGYITHYIIEKKLKPLQWAKITGELLNNSEEFGGIDMALDVDICIKVEKIEKTEQKNFTPKILAYDIETDELKLGKGEILMISLVTNQGFEKVITWKKDSKKKFVEKVKDEAELLERFVECVRKENPDFLVGYFSDGFDLPYIKARAEKFNVNLKLGLDDSQPKFSRGAQLSGKIFGITHIDLLRFIRTAYAQYLKSETLSLNEVAKELLSDTKEDFEIKHSSKLDKDDWENYYDYNLQDSILVKDLFEKAWPDLLEFVKTTQQPIFDLSRAGLSKYTESYILHNLEQFNEIPEKRPTYQEISDRKRLGSVEGAFVLEPKPGLYEKIAMFDFTSMHTSIIITKNLSKGTFIENPTEKQKKETHESPEIQEGNKKVKFYFEKEPGFFPELLKQILELRKKYKEEFKKNPNPITRARSNAFKVLSASAHGYVAFFGARYYSHEASASILAFVRQFNKEIIEKTQKAGFDPIYGDTDSIAFLMNGKNQKQVKEFLKKLNSELPGVMHLELEDFFERGLWVTTRAGKTGAKKKYALMDKEGKIKIRGFETVRRDWCQLARQTQNKIIKQILEDGNSEKALEILKDIVKKIKNREIKQKQIVIKTQLKKPLEEYRAVSPHVVAAQKMQKRKMPIDPGTLIEYYIAEAKPGVKKSLVREKVKLLDEKGKYNIEYYLENQILPAVENIFQVFGINLKEVIEGKRQMTLGEF
jgi:DNA polymerase elongation subunit (family B)